MDAAVARFLEAETFAVVGASNAPEKFGSKVLAAYIARGLSVVPINPREHEVHGLRAFATLLDVPERIAAVSVITPPSATERVVEQAAQAGVEFVWLQPGAESAAAIRRGTELGLTMIHGGPCVLVAFATRRGGRS
ncbi:MAG: CoA-binding protein [Planctomycetota bacterium]